MKDLEDVLREINERRPYGNEKKQEDANEGQREEEDVSCFKLVSYQQNKIFKLDFFLK